MRTIWNPLAHPRDVAEVAADPRSAVDHLVAGLQTHALLGGDVLAVGAVQRGLLGGGDDRFDVVAVGEVTKTPPERGFLRSG